MFIVRGPAGKPGQRRKGLDVTAEASGASGKQFFLDFADIFSESACQRGLGEYKIDQKVVCDGRNGILQGLANEPGFRGKGLKVKIEGECDAKCWLFDDIFTESAWKNGLG